MSRKRLAVLMAGLDKQYQRDYTRGLRETAARMDADLFFFVCQGFPEAERVVDEKSESRILSLPLLQTYDGVITLSRTIPDQEAVARLERRLQALRRVPQVAMDYEGGFGTHILFDDAVSINALVDHMVDTHGCRSFAILTGPRGNTLADDRTNMYLKRIRAKGGQVTHIEDGRWTTQGGRIAAQALLKTGTLPDAILCCNDDMAQSLIAVLNEHGYQVPQDVLVAGFDAGSDALQAGLTTIRRPVYEAGVASVKCCLQADAAEDQLILPTELILGTSCGCSRCAAHEMKPPASAYSAQKLLMAGVGLTSRMCATDDLQHAGQVFVNFARLQRLKHFHIVVDPDFFRSADSGHTSEGPKDVLLLTGVHEGKQEICTSFEREQLVPFLKEEHEPLSLAFLPLYYLDRSIGYMAVDLEQAGSPAMLPLQTLIDCSLMELSQRLAIRGYIDTLQKLTIHDPLTGLNNRRGFYPEAERLMRQARDTGRCFAVLSADMDGLKSINDTYGHIFGDEAIRRMGVAVQQLSSATTVCAHLSGDEFMIAGVYDTVVEAGHLLTQLRSQMDRVGLEDPWLCPVTASAGVFSAVPTQADSLNDFIRFADNRMYENKRARKADRNSMPGQNMRMTPNRPGTVEDQ